MRVLVPSPLGDVVDRCTILAIKRARLEGGARQHAAREQAALAEAWHAAGLPPMAELPEARALAQVNEALWDVEERLRARERAGDFGADFVADARSVYRHNDQRAALKRALNDRLGSEFVEQKSYAGPVG
jgi:hypothetical protein